MVFHYLSGNPVMDALLLAGLLLMGGAIFPFLLKFSPVTAHRSGLIFSAAGCLVGTFSAAMALIGKNYSSLSIPWTTANIQLTLNIDGLAAFFLLPIFIVGFSAALYGYSYMQHDVQRARKIGFHWLFFNILMLSMAAVVTAGNGLQFLIAWEGMSISSFFLVCYDYENDQVCRAGWLYFMATHIGVAFLFFFFLTAASLSGSLDFTSFSALGSISPAMAAGLFFLILIGFGSKAGLFPMHVWLPEAHPAAPSHISALMSGVMIKTAVYGLFRMLTFLPPLPEWCIVTLIATGLVGAVFGISMAASQSDIKRSLAYSTVENINLIFLGIGIWLFGMNAKMPIIAGIALTGTLLHVWNHALFKGLLFMGAGSVLHGTGSRFFHKFGGLLRRMPFSGAMIIFGSAAIAGLPPLNGFISELYLYMSVVLIGQKASGFAAFSALFILSSMILVGGLVLFTVSRMVGMALLGEPRSQEAANAVESAPPMLIGMALLGFLCLLLGVAPALMFAAVAQPLHALSVSAATNLNIFPFLLSKEWTICSVSIICILAVVLWLKTRNAKVPKSSTWGCGFQKPNKRMVYSAAGFSQLAQDSIFCSCVTPHNEAISPLGLFRKPLRFIQHLGDPIFSHVFEPIFANLATRANSFRTVQAGKLNIYLLYIFIATILLLGLDAYQNL